MERGLTSIHP
uniref:Uncharacterized protein n=1 Tax=Oryza sativa subsp. japonica TaxID=39947 RepID=Q2QQY0_ORYSJ|nr:hypothetical protein LOC_Os12g29489 [Oryza sativa Japonica Group]